MSPIGSFEQDNVRSAIRRLSSFSILLLLAFSLPFIASCSSMRNDLSQKTGVSTAVLQQSHKLEGLGLVAVLPFYEDRLEAGKESVRTCRLTNLNFLSGTVEEGGGEVVTETFRNSLASRGFKLVSKDETAEIFNKLLAESGGEYSLALAAKVGKALKADAVVVGSVMRYEDRVGGKMAADKPASAAFSVVFVHSENAEALWTAKFEKTQKALFSDITDYKTFFKGGMVWQRAGQLTQIGVDNILEVMPLYPVR